MPQVTIYTTQSCPYCSRARRLLQRKGVQYLEIAVDDDKEQRQIMAERSGGRTSVPQIFVDDTHVGGYDDLAGMDSCGDLDELLGS